MRPRLVGLLVITCCVILESPVFGQESTVEIRGRVMDAQNAAIAGAIITLTNQATGVVRHAVSNADGTYFITAVSPGLYSLGAGLPGFAKYLRRDVRLDLGRTATLDVHLSVGGLAETVTITSETPLGDLVESRMRLIVR
jgi:trimeric autotransporter adhesin